MVSDVLLYNTVADSILSPIGRLIDAAGTCFMADTQALARKNRQLKTISFVLCTFFLYLTYTTPLATILHTIGSQ